MPCTNQSVKDFLGRYIRITVADNIPGYVAVTILDDNGHSTIMALLPSEARTLAQSLNVYAELEESR